ncbi:hypothetical protein NHG23_08065 [Aerococcaceae bacterium NML190073]|nr:hypothetical protein [Aerococcaceae bacterium NML190073]MCW6677378.1 hypothetical protein [Aerococcaceae bacterium NML180378]
MFCQTKKHVLKTVMLSSLLLSSLAPSVLAADSQLPAELNANMHTVIDKESEAIIYNGHEYQYDVTSGATPLPARLEDGKQPEAMSLEEKEQFFHWTVQPPKGLIMGEYFTTEQLFGAADSQYKAIVELVVDAGKIVHVELDEYTPETYYDETWAGKPKRNSGYAFFQFSKPRTDMTHVTWSNGITFLEWQILKANNIAIEFDTITGSSNSAREGFIPAIQAMNKEVQEASNKYYIGYVGETVDGVTPRLELVFDGKNIADVRYDEYLADNKDDVKDEALKPFYRQSKHDSLDYNSKEKNPALSQDNEFIDFVAQLKAKVLEAQSLDVELENAPKEFANYQALVEQVKPAVEHYLANGYTHDIGTITEKSEDARAVRDAGISGENFELKVVSADYDEAGETIKAEVEVTNNGEVDYHFNTSAIHFIVHPQEADASNENFGPLFGHMSQGNTSNNVGERVANSLTEDVTVKAGETIKLSIEGKPVYPTDTGVKVRLYTKKLDMTVPLVSEE